MIETSSSADIAAIKSMALEVLQEHPAGLMLVALREAVNEELVTRRIIVRGCGHEQLRYALRWLVRHGFIGIKPAENRQENHYTYFYIKGGDLLRSDALRKRADQTPAIPTKRLTPMDFVRHVLQQIPTTLSPLKD